MNVDDRLAPVEFGIDRRESGVAEIAGGVAGEQANAVGLERIETVFDFLQAAFDVRRRDAGPQAETPGMVAHEGGAVVVEFAQQRARFIDVAEPGAGLDDRQHRGLDAAFVHVLDRHLR